VFTGAGTLAVKLKVTDSDGDTDVLTRTEYITVVSETCSYLPVKRGSSNEQLNFNRDISVTVIGGHNCDFTTNTGDTTVNGTNTISTGTVIIEKFIVN
jgi:hypothetical protein